MPIYEYRCTSCDHAFEELVRSSADAGDLKCPVCGKSRVERRLSVFSARDSAGKSSASIPSGGGCGHCGDPHGPCGLS